MHNPVRDLIPPLALRHAAPMPQSRPMIRRRIGELMDDPALDRKAHARALRSLNRINRLLGVDRCLARHVRAIAGGAGSSILDLGSGGGGFLSHLSRDRQGFFLRIGMDRSAFALECAQAWHPDAMRPMVADARGIPLADDSIDVVTCSLFLHHFDAPDATTILREAARVARLGIVVCDLARSRLAWITTRIATRLLSRSHIVHVDGPRSVRAAFRVAELSELARLAGLENALIVRRMPFRFVLLWRKRQPDKGTWP